ncbi:MAG TPA: cytochrome P450, partial [Trebonia sp.]
GPMCSGRTPAAGADFCTSRAGTVARPPGPAARAPSTRAQWTCSPRCGTSAEPLPRRPAARATSSPPARRAERFASGRPAWSYLPFAAGPRTCLGAHLARLILRTALIPLCHGDLAQAGGNPAVAVGITLRPSSPLHMRARRPGGA